MILTSVGAMKYMRQTRTARNMIIARESFMTDWEEAGDWWDFYVLPSLTQVKFARQGADKIHPVRACKKSAGGVLPYFKWGVTFQIYI